jgi:hypothetical protein
LAQVGGAAVEAQGIDIRKQIEEQIRKESGEADLGGGGSRQEAKFGRVHADILAQMF